MGLTVKTAAAIAYALLKERRRIEWRNRMEGNISRWEDSIYRLERAIDKKKNNKINNQNKLYKAEEFLNKMTSGKSKEWYERALKKQRKFSHLDAKIQSYESKIESVKSRICTLKTWISNDESSITGIKRKIEDIKYKIDDVERKL